MSSWKEYREQLDRNRRIAALASIVDTAPPEPSMPWESAGFKHISFEKCYSPHTSYTSNLRSEYAAPELISYSFNSFNFRSKEFHEDTNIVALGCSHTFGVGVPENLTWPSFIKELTGVEDVVNLGKPGSSIALQVRMLATYIRAYGAPKIVLCNFPELARYQHITESGEIVNGHTHMGLFDNSYTNAQASTQSILALGELEAICRTNGIILRWQTWCYQGEYFEYKFIENFNSYVKNKFTGRYLELYDPYVDSDTNEICGSYSHDAWPEECCTDLKNKSNGCFNYGYDRYLVPKKHQKFDFIIEKKELEALKKSTLYFEDNRPMGHFGSHAHWHWAKNLVDSL
jgi:hypothetical protein